MWTFGSTVMFIARPFDVHEQKDQRNWMDGELLDADSRRLALIFCTMPCPRPSSGGWDRLYVSLGMMDKGRSAADTADYYY